MQKAFRTIVELGMRGGKEFLEFSLHLTIKSKTAYVIVFAFAFVFVFVL